MSTSFDIDSQSIKQSILRQRQVEKEKQEADELAKLQENENKIKSYIVKVIEKDIKKQIELDEKQKNLKKYFNIVKEEEKAKIEEEKKEQFKNKCETILEWENFSINKFTFKFFAWVLILIGFFKFIGYFGTIFDRINE